MTRYLPLLFGVLALPLAAAPTNPLAPPDAARLLEARALVQGMVDSERGPYSRVVWFCRDGSVQPPRPQGCADRGGGRQHGEYSPQRQRLADLGWSVGTVFAALEFDRLWQLEGRQPRLRQLPLERYLEEIDDGWVLRRARHYRGRIQVEDEERRGRELLLRLLAQREWVQTEFLLVREAARVIPHGGDDDRTRTVRRLSQEIAERDPSFATLRIEVHSRPSATTAHRVRGWIAARPDLASDLRDLVTRLADGLDANYGEAGRTVRLLNAISQLERRTPQVATTLRAALAARGEHRVGLLADAMVALRGAIDGHAPAVDLVRLDLLQELEAELRVAALEVLDLPGLARRTLLRLAAELLRAAWGGGWLTRGEQEAVNAALLPLEQASGTAGAAYAEAVRWLGQVPGWATLSVRHAFAEALVGYSALDPRAARFVDDLLRGSLLLPLGELAHRLSADAAAIAGIAHAILGRDLPGVVGINPGVARGRLRVLEPGDPERGVRAANDEIVVLPETAAELGPVAGILTLGEGNLLSHVQMLARNLGIPNATIPPTLLANLRELAGSELLLAVAGDGRVVLERVSQLPAGLASKGATAAAPVAMVDAPRPDLAVRRPLPLAELHSGLSGRIVGPKAANVGQLARLFPGRIAPAVALPFGIFAEHTAAPRMRLAEAFRRARAGELDQAGLDTELDAVRSAVQAVTLDPGRRTELVAAMSAEFGPNPGVGLFVRSDTNVEDLPEFTGAGLNETVPNVVGLERQLAAVARVWASPYSRRAMAWRARVLNRPEEVYTSVLLMQSVPSEKSGVLVTRDLAGGGDGLTVSVAWGVGGAVDNESAASLVLRPDGATRLLAEAKAAYRRVLQPGGGIDWVPAPVGPVLGAAEEDALRELAAEVLQRYPPAHDAGGRTLPWDIEFAFAGGRLWLLQIRPLVQRGLVQADHLVDLLLPAPTPTASVQLDAPPAGATR